MSKKRETNTNKFSTTKSPSLAKIRSYNEVTEYKIRTNGLTVLYVHKPGSSVVTSNIMYKVGSRDEKRGETGIAHMLEHMVFKPTSHDVKRKTDSAAMVFESETGAIVNANTWKDRTTYYFSYPSEHFDRALRIEAERMHGVILTDKQFKPERTNVLSEYDMYAGEEEFALSVQMSNVAFQSHPYGHETIGFREDIEAYTTEMLQTFYETYYAPNNAVLTVIGDVTEAIMKKAVLKHFGLLTPSLKLTPRIKITEPKQEGLRTITIKRKSSTNVYALGILNDGFPQKGWFETMAILDMLAGGTDSILHKKLVDTGLATQIQTSIEPLQDKNLATIFVILSTKATNEKIHTIIQNTIKSLTLKIIKPYLKKTTAKALVGEYTTRESSLGYTAELVEYISAGAPEQFFATEKLLTSITPRDILIRAKSVFDESQITIGYFIGTP
ncbi:MAG: insulinase family protein [Candidatus Pacebacteria bacterium]|nr:insulinase family protein [Candidatus Paceibacterota bacterium]MCF7857061.1 insulinase family protein [Candidatus Paceibacterota bacterium]